MTFESVFECFQHWYTVRCVTSPIKIPIFQYASIFSFSPQSNHRQSLGEPVIASDPQCTIYHGNVGGNPQPSTILNLILDKPLLLDFPKGHFLIGKDLFRIFPRRSFPPWKRGPFLLGFSFSPLFAHSRIQLHACPPVPHLLML